MIWLALGVSVIFGGIAMIITRSVRRGLRVGLIALILGVGLSLLLVYGGFMGG